MEPIEINKRVTLFLNEPLSLEGEMMQQIQENFTGVLDLSPVYNRKIQLKIAQSGLDTSEERGIEMRRTNESLRVTFDKSRIDIFSTQGGTMQEFMNDVNTIVGVLNQINISQYRRLAMCHQIYYQCNEEQYQCCYKSIFNDASKPSVEWNAQRVMREPIVESSELMLNNILFIGRVLNANVNETLINEKLLINVDINTIPGSNVDIVNTNQNLFFERAIQLIEEHERTIGDILTE